MENFISVVETVNGAINDFVWGVPCLVLLKDGEFTDQSVGFRPEPQLTAWIDSNL